MLTMLELNHRILKLLEKKCVDKEVYIANYADLQMKLWLQELKQEACLLKLQCEKLPTKNTRLAERRKDE